MAYQVERIRKDFPSLNTGLAYFDGPGGTQTPKVVGDAIAKAITEPLSNQGTTTASEQNADDCVTGYRNAVADLLNCDPKGVVYHHRGAAINAISNILEWDMPKHAVYLWTLPMFHCNGWCFPWTLAARAGVNVCLRKFDAQQVLALIAKERVTHYCGAPIVQSALASAPEEWRSGITHRVSTMVAAAPPAAARVANTLAQRSASPKTIAYGR